MRVDRVRVGQLETNCWVVSDDGAGPAVVIDPGDDAHAVLETLGDREIALIVLTHGHFDHLGAVSELVETRLAPVAVHRDDAEFITSAQTTGGTMFGFPEHAAPPADRILDDGDTVEVGDLSFQVLHTPGHTPGSICLLVFDPVTGTRHLFSGDTLFAGSVGRSDFPRGDSRALVRSLAAKLVQLPRDTLVHPGHGPDTTVGREAAVNPFWPRA
jgi:hydroxyacylglutathione hydrolase